MVGVIGLAILGVVTLVTLKVVRNFLRNLEKAKKTGLPYVIGRKLNFLGCFNALCASGAWCLTSQPRDSV
jgi:hypothetical protein